MPLRLSYMSQLNAPLTAAQTSNTFTGPQDLVASTVSPIAPLTIPANYWEAGASFELVAFGTFSTTGTPTLVLGTYVGTTALGVNVAVTTPTGSVTLPWRLETTTSIRSIGAAGANSTAVTQGFLKYGTTLTAAMTDLPVPGIALAPVSYDNTIANILSVKATWSASSASNIVVLHGLIIKELTQT